MFDIRLSLVFSIAIHSFAIPRSLAREIPDNVQAFYDSIRDRGECENVLAGGFHSADGDSGDFDYCGDYLDDYKVIYLQGKGGQLVNLDVDCDGVQGSDADDGRCESSDDTQSITSFQDELENYDVGHEDLDANIHPYVVFGNQGEKDGWPTFDPRDYGIEPLSVMAVVCNDKLVYGIWGDENGDDGEEAMVGEGSVSLATACFGKGMSGNSGHDENDVLFIAFVGDDAVPGADGVDWTAKNASQFQQSLGSLGDTLIERIEGGSAAGAMPSLVVTLAVVVLSCLFV